MLASVIIPSHNPKFLTDAVNSVLKQHWDGELEIVVVTDKIEVTFDDPRVRVIAFDGESGNIGALKRFGFDAAKGDILVELDHDDLLAPEAISKIAKALTLTDFAYSNCAMFHDDWSPHTYGEYGEKCGWKYRDVSYEGHALKEAVAFDPTPASIGHIWWAPDHVRAWTRNGYAKAGKHDPTLKVADDHDLVIHSYLYGTMTHIDECLYYYRIGNNTSAGERNAFIQTETHRLYSKWIDDIVRRWCYLNTLPCYDLGGFHNTAPGWDPVDIHINGIDLRNKWPWPDNSVGAFRAYDFLEHLPDKMHSLSEMHRCLVPGGWALTCTPSALGRGAFQDPTHISYWVKNSFKYVTDSNFARYIGNETVRFQEHRLVEDSPWSVCPNPECKAVHESDTVPYVTADLVALKPGYTGPGEVNI